MSTLFTNRVQSAHSRSSHRLKIDGQDAHLKPRSTSSIGIHQPYADIFDQDDRKTPESFAHSPPPNRRSRPKTASISTRASTRSASRKLRSDEIDSLLRSLDRDDTYIVQVDCLADYRTLVQTIDLRKTPLDCQLLCALQQRENRIVQQNACRDVRFRSLMEVLAPAHVLKKIEEEDSNDAHRTTMLDYPPGDFSYEYLK